MDWVEKKANKICYTEVFLKRAEFIQTEDREDIGWKKKKRALVPDRQGGSMEL